MKEKAVKTYRELITLFPNSEWAEDASSASPFYLCRTKMAEAIEEWTKWSAIFPKVIFLSRPMLNWEVSIFSFKITQKLSNDTNGWLRIIRSTISQEGLFRMEEGYRNLGKTDQAEKILKELIAGFPQDDIQFEGQLKLGILFSPRRNMVRRSPLFP